METKKAVIFQAVRLAKNPFFSKSKALKNLFALFSFVSFLVFVFLAFSERAGQLFLEKAGGYFMLSFSLYLLFLEIEKFFELKIKKPDFSYSLKEAAINPENFNLFSFFDFEAATAFYKAKKIAKKKKIKEVSDEIFLYALLDQKIKLVRFIAFRAPIDLGEFRKELKEKINSKKRQWLPGCRRLVEKAARVAYANGQKRIKVGNLLEAAYSEIEDFEKFLTLNNLKDKDIANLSFWFHRIEDEIEKRKKFWLEENLKRNGRIGRDWASGYSITLDNYSYDLREKIRKNGFHNIVGHRREILMAERILEKEEENNILLVGEAGVGRKSIIEAIAQRAFLGKSSPSVNFKRILFLDIGQVVAEFSAEGRVGEILDRCFSEAVSAGNIILVIDNIHHFLLPSKDKDNNYNIAGILSRYLPLPNFQLIGITDYQSLHNVIEKQPTVLNLFEKVEVEEVSENETLEFLENLVPYLERKRKKFITYKALKEIVFLSAKYIKDSPFPDKALKVLDEAVSWISLEKKGNILTDDHIKTIISQKTEIPLEDLEEKEKSILLNLEDLIHQRIINQEPAVEEVSNALRRARANIRSRSGPIGSFLFLGPTGVGKTETAKALSKIYFGAESKMIRLDMSEFQEISDIRKLVGEGGEGLLTTPVRENPFSLVLLDEIEKAHPNILNLFLQVLDEGWLTDGFGRKVDFKNTIIIATSNAGSEMIREKVSKEEVGELKEELTEYLLQERIFRPEFVNRFDGVIVFKPLTEQNLVDIAQLMLKSVVANLRDKGIKFFINGELKRKIAELGYSPQFGAREMRRVIQDKVENLLARNLLDGSIKRGDEIEIKVENNNFILKKLEKENYEE